MHAFILVFLLSSDPVTYQFTFAFADLKSCQKAIVAGALALPPEKRKAMVDAADCLEVVLHEPVKPRAQLKPSGKAEKQM